MKNYNIIVNLISAPAKALIHLGKSLWFFVFQGKGKGERTSVLREGKEAFLYGLLHSHRWEGKREGGKGHVDHHIKGSKEEEEEGAIFKVGKNGDVWVYKNIILETHKASGYIVSVKGVREGWEERDTITCYVPNLLALYDFLNYFTQGRKVLFNSVAEFKPLL